MTGASKYVWGVMWIGMSWETTVSCGVHYGRGCRVPWGFLQFGRISASEEGEGRFSTKAERVCRLVLPGVRTCSPLEEGMLRVEGGAWVRDWGWGWGEEGGCKKLRGVSLVGVGAMHRLVRRRERNVLPIRYTTNRHPLPQCLSHTERSALYASALPSPSQAQVTGHGCTKQRMAVPNTSKRCCRCPHLSDAGVWSTKRFGMRAAVKKIGTMPRGGAGVSSLWYATPPPPQQKCLPFRCLPSTLQRMGREGYMGKGNEKKFFGRLRRHHMYGR